jgi:hypothetical protein
VGVNVVSVKIGFDWHGVPSALEGAYYLAI